MKQLHNTDIQDDSANGRLNWCTLLCIFILYLRTWIVFTREEILNIRESTPLDLFTDIFSLPPWNYWTLWWKVLWPLARWWEAGMGSAPEHWCASGTEDYARHSRRYSSSKCANYVTRWMSCCWQWELTENFFYPQFCVSQSHGCVELFWTLPDFQLFWADSGREVMCKTKGGGDLFLREWWLVQWC